MSIEPDDWPARERRWRRRLGRLRLGVEPLAEQLARMRATVVALSIVGGLVGLAFVALFSAFHAPWIGLGMAAVLLGIPVGLAWIDYGRHRARAAAFEAERSANEAATAAGVDSPAAATTTPLNS